MRASFWIAVALLHAILFAQTDTANHRIQRIAVGDNVDLEVLDWGGPGRPLLLLTGLGDTAHVYDKFAPKLTGSYHVYGLTRRGFGKSSAPASGYSADRLGDDVLAVIDELKLDKPVLVGHSIGGEELSSVGSRHPEKVAGLVYLDAAYGYAYYDRGVGDFYVDLADLHNKLGQLRSQPVGDLRLIQELLSTSLPAFEKALRDQQKVILSVPPAMRGPQTQASPSAAWTAVLAGVRKYTDIRVPILAIFAVPHDLGPAFRNDPAGRAAFDALDEVTTGAQAKAFEIGVPTARLVRLPHADHYVFRSNEADVLREMNAFIASLP